MKKITPVFVLCLLEYHSTFPFLLATSLSIIDSEKSEL